MLLPGLRRALASGFAASDGNSTSGGEAEKDPTAGEVGSQTAGQPPCAAGLHKMEARVKELAALATSRNTAAERDSHSQEVPLPLCLAALFKPHERPPGVKPPSRNLRMAPLLREFL
mmetsp:Transcript_89716/g.155270  ORF Transcript_89716/g.155270 Transcript_89716/m.155270 type:complete len:117 (-) Transcript_89716:28-378(-)